MAMVLVMAVGTVLRANGAVESTFTTLRGLLKGGPILVQEEVLPPVGAIWFGSGFDPITHGNEGRTRVIAQHGTVSLVARVPHSLPGQGGLMRVSVGGVTVASKPVPADLMTVDDLWLLRLDAPGEAGMWQFDFVSAAGDLLATGQVLVR